MTTTNNKTNDPRIRNLVDSPTGPETADFIARSSEGFGLPAQEVL